MSTTTNLSQLDLWSFIKSRKAINSAPLKTLQKFILSLNKGELIHVINCYLQSTLTTVTSPNGLSYKNSTDILLNKNANKSINNNKSTDQKILHKLKRNFRNKKIVSQFQQNHNENKHLLSINCEALAYSFQFLSYKELCNIQTVSIYFTYLTKKYNGLTHYFINMDQTLLLSIMKNKIDLNQLSQFKHIEISYMYLNKCAYNKDSERQSILFKYILKTVISQSINQLHTLTINIQWNIISHTVYYIRQNIHSLHKPIFNVLLQITNEFECLPNIKTLRLNRDIFKPSSQITVQEMLQKVQLRILKTFPNLRNFVFGIDRLDNYTSWSKFPLTNLRQSIIIPTINHYIQLETLDLYFNSFGDNSWFLDTNIIQLIAVNLKNLKELSICTFIKHDAFTDASALSSEPNSSLQTLNIRIRSGRMYTTQGTQSEIAEKFLSELFSSFVGIDTFSFVGIGDNNDYVIDWLKIIHHLLRAKAICSLIYKKNIAALYSLNIKYCSSVEIENILNTLMCFRNDLYLDIKHLAIDAEQKYGSYYYGNKMNTILENHLIPFMSIFDDINTIQLKFNAVFLDDDFSYESILNVLRNLPKSLISLELNLPWYENNEAESIKLVKKLCDMLISDTDSKLQSIVFDKFQMNMKAKQFLIFMFGYNNKFHIHDDKCYLSFI